MNFRTRIFAISILTVSAVLMVVISLSWSRIMKLELDHLDDRLCMEARRIISTRTHPKPIKSPLNENETLSQLPISNDSKLLANQFIDDLVDKLRISSANQLMIFVESDEDSTLSKSKGAEIQKITSNSKRAEVQKVISRLSWVNANQFESADKNHAKSNCQLASFEHQKNHWRASYFGRDNSKSFVAVDVAATASQLKSTLREALIVVIPFSLLLSILGAWFITANTIRPIKRLHKSMDRVTQKDLSHRLPEHKEDKEFKRLIAAYNTMLDRLEDSFQQISRFTSDAAHELKTPLTVLRGKLEQAVISDNSSQLDLNAILDEVGHLSAITRKLLLLSQADSGSMALHFEPINMSDLLDELTADMELLSEHLVLDCSIEPSLILKGDIVLLRQLLNNLLVNMMRYSLHEKGVIIQAKQNGSNIDVFISNHCLAMSENVRSQLFDRFYRGEPDRLQGIAGSGLGLSLAREIARAHGGDLTLQASLKDVFTIKLLLPIVK